MSVKVPYGERKHSLQKLIMSHWGVHGTPVTWKLGMFLEITSLTLEVHTTG